MLRGDTMQDFSLLFPQNSHRNFNTLTDEAINDLSIDYICDALTEDNYEKNLMRKIMIQITDNREVISYRCDIFDDFLKFPELRENLSQLIVKLADLKEIERFQKDSDASSLWMLINRLREIDDYVSCITEIKNTLEKLNIKSEGMLRLKEIVTNIYSDSGFPELKKDINETLGKAQRLKSITIGVNLDSLLRPKNAGVLSLNDTEFGKAGLMKHFMNFADSKDDLHHGNNVENIKSFHPANPSSSTMIFGSIQQSATHNVHIETNDITGADPLSDALKKTVTDILKRTVKSIKSTLRKYVNISGYALINLMPEIIFYIRWAELVDKIMAKGMPMCKAEIVETNKRYCSFKEIYNLKLSIKNVSGEEINIITNNVNFDDNHRIFVLTGPNRGGKTTFTQAVGLAMLMAQWGVYVPASNAVISACDNIYTHFPADENNTVDLGRLGEESKRLSEIFNVATKNSLLLLNESLATTNVAEGLYIAKDVVKSMRYLGTRAIFNTHMHDLARNLEEINDKITGDSIVASMITGVNDSGRSFKVSIAPPQGVSYAKDIAKKYGVTFEQIKSNIDKKC
jgi:DNA mismatch repair ATPase MutS